MAAEAEMNQVLKEYLFPGGQKLQLVQGDITSETVDAIVNAANDQLLHGAGVAAAIARKGGPSIQQESDAWIKQHGSVSHSEPAFTGGGNLPARYVIHAVGPVWGMGNEDARLTQAVQGSLRRADELKLRSIAFPAISTGIFRFPKERAAKVIYAAIAEYLGKTPGSGLNLIRLTLYDQPTIDAFQRQWQEQGLEPDQAG